MRWQDTRVLQIDGNAGNADPWWTAWLTVGSIVGGGLVGSCLGRLLLWLQVLVHEVAHALALALVGGRATSLEVGSGRFVLARWWFGLRVELRPRASHGCVHGAVLGTWAYRLRWTIVLLAGPLASSAFATAIGLPLAALWRALVGASVSPAWLLILMGLIVFPAVGAILSWWPRETHLGGLLLASDVLATWRLWRRTPAALAEHRLATQGRYAVEATFERFLAGEPRRARADLADLQLAPADEWTRLVYAPLYTWAADGAAAALPLQRLAEQGFEPGMVMLAPDLQRESAAWQAATRLALRVTLLFLLVEAHTAASRQEAATIAGELQQMDGIGPAAWRVLGLHALHAGAAAAGPRLEAAWRCAEPAYLRAITALGLALLHARAGRTGRARRFLRKARRLHPTAPMLPRYTVLVENALAEARVAA